MGVERPMGAGGRRERKEPSSLLARVWPQQSHATCRAKVSPTHTTVW